MAVNSLKKECYTDPWFVSGWVSRADLDGLPDFLTNDTAPLVCDVTVIVYSVTTQSGLCNRGVAREYHVTA
jgi:hypothetical protein